MEQMEQVEVKLLKYTFLFKRMRWLDDSTIKFEGRNSQRVVLAHALLKVSGITPKDLQEALRVMDAIPAAIVDRVFRLWRGSFPPARKFTTSNLYKAPDTQQYEAKVEADTNEEEVQHDKLMQEMQSKFGPEEMAEAQELNQHILNAARRRDGGYRGAIPVSEGKHGQ
jgi:hypothetical protein